VTVGDLLAELRKLDVHVVLDDDRLRLNAPAGVLSEEHKRDLAERKHEIIGFLREAQQLSSQQRAIVPLQAAGTRTPIFAVAGHNGDVFAYRWLAEHLGPDQPFFGLQPPGLEEGSEPLTRVEDLAGYFAEQVRAFQPAGPMTIAGFCSGGTIAYELARQLTTSGASITNLILFGAPYCSSYRALQQRVARARYLTGRSVTHTRALLTLPAAERARYLADRARVLLPREANDAEGPSDPVLDRRRAVEDATMAAVSAYTPQPSGCHIDFMIPCESWQRSADDPLRWGRLAASSAVFVGPDDCNGDIMLKPEHAKTFAGHVADAQHRHARGGASKIVDTGRRG
jgi:thioesterase domain-containing protein